MSTISYKTSSPAGDLFSFLAGVRQLWADTGKKGIVYQRIGMVGNGYPDSIQPFKNEQGEPVCMSVGMFNKLRPLLLSQDYIEDYVQYDGEDVDFDFDILRLGKFTGQPLGSLHRWPAYCFPQMAADHSKPWVSVPRGELSGKILINFTARYRNNVMTYYFLRKYESNLVFVGLPDEHEIFCKKWGVWMPHLAEDNFLELAKEMANCKFFLGNASACYHLAEAMKVPRILETFPNMPHVIPIGENAFDFYHQDAGEYYFNKLITA